MRMESGKKWLSYIFCVALTAVMVLFASGCNGGSENVASSGTQADVGNTEASAVTDADSRAEAMTDTDSEAADSSDAAAGVEVLGEGNRKFIFNVTDKEGNETTYEIHTDAETVGEALLELGLIDGDDSEFGLYVKTVNGITADYDTDGVYWAFYVNGEYAQTGVDSTEVTEGDVYSFKVE